MFSVPLKPPASDLSHMGPNLILFFKRKEHGMEKKKIKIAYCTFTDPYNKRAWSGIHYFIMNALSNIGDLSVMGPLRNKWVLPLKIFNKIIRMFFKRKISPNHTTVVSKEYAKQLSKKIKNKKFDYIFCPAGSVIIAHLKTDIPIVYLSDATFFSLTSYYPGFSDLIETARKMGEQIEKYAIEKSKYIIFTSDWAAKDAKKHYGCSGNKISIIPFGSNMGDVPLLENIMARRSAAPKKLKLLWVGVDWERKRGQVAYDVMVEMNRRNVDTELIVCGCTPLINNPHVGLKCKGFLDKNTIEESKVLRDLYLEATFFILPTKSECAGIVFCEAAAFALPAIATDTGGVAFYVEDKKTGYLFDENADYAAYADVIERLWWDKNEYKSLCCQARKKYEDKLNWLVWEQEVSKLLCP